MNNCCKESKNWKNNGSRDKEVRDFGDAVNIKNKNYIECKICNNKMHMLNDKTLVDITKTAPKA